MANIGKRILQILLLYVGICVTASAAEPFRIGVAGVTHDHLNGVVSQLRQGDIQVVGVWEADERYLHSNSLTRLVPENLFFSDLGKMLDETHPEAVVAYGSIKEHLTVVKACAPRGIHVMGEKPLATTYDEAKEMEALARKHGILLLTNYETTWYASNHYIKQEADAGRIGPIHRIEVYDGHQGPSEIGCSKKFLDWLTDPVLNGGGAVMDFGCYGANLATWILGGQRPVSVYAVLKQNKPEVYPKVDDDATIILDYSGTTVQINASWCWPYNRKDMYVYGKKGFLYQPDPKHVTDAAGKPGIEAPSLAAPIDNPFRYLAAAVRGELTVKSFDLCSLENNMIVMEILSAAVKSSRTGVPVRLDGPKNDGFAEAEPYFLNARKALASNDLIMNPVSDFDCADPSVVKIGGWFYCFATGFPIRIYRSRNLCQWEFYRNMFPGPSPDDPYGDGKKDPMKTGAKSRINYWAPSPAVINGKVVVYLTLFVSMENDRQVVCVADDIDGEFRYAGTLNIGTPDHPTPQDGQFFLDDDGRQYLVWGDVNSKGNYIRELTSDGLRYKPGSKPHYITKAYEGGYIYKYGGKYYFFCSKGYYNTADYTLGMSVSDRLDGEWPEPVPVLKSDNPEAILNGAGHNGEIITDSQGRMFMVMHTHCEGLIPLRGSYHPRPMMLMELKEIDGTLTFVNHKGEPTTRPEWLVQRPVFR